MKKKKRRKRTLNPGGLFHFQVKADRTHTLSDKNLGWKGFNDRVFKNPTVICCHRKFVKEKYQMKCLNKFSSSIEYLL